MIDIKLKYKRDDYKNISTAYIESDWVDNDYDRKKCYSVFIHIIWIIAAFDAKRKQSSGTASSTETEEWLRLKL